jgi:hypothetical protein
MIMWGMTGAQVELGREISVFQVQLGKEKLTIGAQAEFGQEVYVPKLELLNEK